MDLCKLSVGYRYIEGLKDTPIIKQNQLTRGHEFHYWEIENNLSESDLKKEDHHKKLSSPWKIKSKFSRSRKKLYRCHPN